MHNMLLFGYLLPVLLVKCQLSYGHVHDLEVETPEFVNDPIPTHVSSPKVENYLKMNAIAIVLKTQKHIFAVKRDTKYNKMKGST